MKRAVSLLLLIAVLLTGTLAGCGETPEPDYSRLIEALTDISPDLLLTEAEVSAAVGTPMTLQGCFDEGTLAYYTANPDAALAEATVSVSLEKRDAAAVRALGEERPCDSRVTDLGETGGYWYGDVNAEEEEDLPLTGELLVGDSGYALDVAVTGAPNPYNAAVTIAEALLGHLHEQRNE